MVEDKYIDGKYRKKYADKHGVGSLINVYHGLPWNNNESEKVYKICLEEKITWEEYYKIKSNKKLIY